MKSNLPKRENNAKGQQKSHTQGDKLKRREDVGAERQMANSWRVGEKKIDVLKA